ncbi:MAG: hypothetical protein ACRDPC_18570 [Solirubrobacteraceae bacterium]
MTTAAAGATGIRTWLATRRYSWLTPGRMRFATMFMVGAGVIGASVGLSGT